ncbi:MAG: thrombospondin type 3 repeat-containing protein [Chromatiales bacterium]|nr:thrombospondin type 3 repeat-containing protein [Chromatiales bacterium]
MTSNRTLATAVAAALGMTAGTGDAAVYSATLTQALTYANNAPFGSACNFSSSTATWTYDDVSGVLTQTGGEYNLRVSSGPSTLYRTLITGLVIGNGQLATANSYVCIEGNFGATVGASICGNYYLGGNYIDESTTGWGPGTAYSRTLGGDDYAAGTPQNLDRFHGMYTVSFTPGGTLVLTNKSCTGTCPPGGNNFGHQWTFGNLQLIEDADGDGVVDVVDNCAQVANPSQCDSDGDGYGNHCDADLNNNGATNAQDTTLFRQQLGQPSAGPAYNAADLNCSGAVNAQDTVRFRQLLGKPPGPSGQVP